MEGMKRTGRDPALDYFTDRTKIELDGTVEALEALLFQSGSVRMFLGDALEMG